MEEMQTDGGSAPQPTEQTEPKREDEDAEGDAPLADPEE